MDRLWIRVDWLPIRPGTRDDPCAIGQKTGRCRSGAGSCSFLLPGLLRCFSLLRSMSLSLHLSRLVFIAVLVLFCSVATAADRVDLARLKPSGQMAGQELGLRFLRDEARALSIEAVIVMPESLPGGRPRHSHAITRIEGSAGTTASRRLPPPSEVTAVDGA